MASLNKVFLIGNLTREPELRFIPSGTAVATFTVAVNRTYTSQSGEKKEEVCFARVVVWGKQAESCSQYLAKGSQVFVEGRLIYRTWEQEGKTRNMLEVRADRVQFLGRPKAGGPIDELKDAAPEEIQAALPAANSEESEGDVPF